MSAWNGKLYLITRADLPPGQQAVQAAHALAEFGIRYPGTFSRWHAESNTLVMLTVEDKDKLVKLWSKANMLAERAARRDFFVFPVGAMFQEPDRNNEPTAIAFAPSGEFERLCRNLPLALQAPVA